MIDDGAKRGGGNQRSAGPRPSEESRSQQHVTQVIARIVAKRLASTKKEASYRAADLPDPDSDANHD